MQTVGPELFYKLLKAQENTCIKKDANPSLKRGGGPQLQEAVGTLSNNVLLPADPAWLLCGEGHH
jgi:hypothetical protein